MIKVGGALAVLAAMVVAIPVHSNEGRERLLRDLVHIKNSKFEYEEFTICGLNHPGSSERKFQMRSYAEAPTHGAVSRDWFVALVQQFATAVSLGIADSIPGMKPSEALNALDCEPLDAPIGEVDIELGITMTADGLQIEVKDTASGKVDRRSQTWKEMFE